MAVLTRSQTECQSRTLTAKNVWLCRVHAGWTRAECASRLGISVGSIMKYEQGWRVPRDWVRKRMKSLFGVAVDRPLRLVNDDTSRHD